MNFKANPVIKRIKKFLADNLPILHGDRQSNEIYLTFDDGPQPGCTPFILDVLKKLQLRATFFVLGENVIKYPELIQRIIKEKHELGIHSFQHRSLLFQPQRTILHNLQRACWVVEDCINRKPSLFRPPFGRFGWNTWQTARKLGLKIVLWDIMPHDYRKDVEASVIVQRVNKQLKAGSIIVLHDNLEIPEKLVHSLPQICKHAHDRGFKFKTLS